MSEKCNAGLVVRLKTRRSISKSRYEKLISVPGRSFINLVPEST